MRGRHFFFRILACVAAVAVSLLPVPVAYANYSVTIPGKYLNPEWLPERNRHDENVRVTLTGVPDDMIPNSSNKWNCDCSTSGCWPGCFTLASASIMKYWSQKGYPTLYNGDENAVLVRLRQLFPNMLCYGNGDTSGKPSDVGYDAFDVATGLMQYTRANGYVFTARAIPEPTFTQIMDEIDAGRPVIGAFAESPWGSHAGTIVGYDTTNGRKIMIVRPNLWKKLDMDIEWGVGYKGFGIVTVLPPYPTSNTRNAAKTETAVKPQINVELVVGTKDAGFAAQGNWQLNDNVGLNGDARSHITTDPSNLGPTDDTGWARWTPDIPYDGVWEALVWVPVRDGDDDATHNATYRVTHAEGMSLVRRSQHDASQGWMSLGNFPFIKGSKGSIYVGNLTGDFPLRKVWADAVKLVWRAPLLVRDEPEDAPIYLIQQGKRMRVPDQQTFDALRLNRSNIRVLTTMALAQYPDGGLLPSVFTSWVGQYYDNTQLESATALVRSDAHVSFDWSTAPAPVLNASNFSARWSRRMAFTDGHFPFVLNASGNARLFVDGEQVISNWDADNRGLYLQQSAMVTLTSGLHLVEIEYFSRAANGQIALAPIAP
ncbi:MAG TPA: PA14 domain-containing protein, partial [Anaerolineae bacterium]